MDIEQFLLLSIGVLVLYFGAKYYIYSLNKYGEGGLSENDKNFKDVIVSDLKKNNRYKTDVIQTEIEHISSQLRSTNFLNFKKKKMLSDVLSALKDIIIDLKSK